MSIPKLNEETCKIHFDELGLSELKSIFTKDSRRKYNKSQDATTILNALKTSGWIYDYKEDEQKSDKYIISKNKLRGWKSA